MDDYLSVSEYMLYDCQSLLLDIRTFLCGSKQKLPSDNVFEKISCGKKAGKAIVRKANLQEIKNAGK